MGLSIGFFALFALFGSLDYATIFNLTPFMNETVITIIALLLLTGAMAKSAQIPLHSWLPGSMEGLKIIKFYVYLSIFILLFIYDYYYYYDYLLNSQQLSLLPFFNTIPKSTLHTITGNMLGDGSIRFNKNNNLIGEAKYAMTMDVYSLNYLNHLFDKIYSQYSSTGIKGYPNIMLPQHKGKEIIQYHFSTRSHPLFTVLHNI